MRPGKTGIAIAQKKEFASEIQGNANPLKLLNPNQL
jgi:hypothetical protein